MSATPARSANSTLVHPFSAMSSAISCPLNRTVGDCVFIANQKVVDLGWQCQQQVATRVNNANYGGGNIGRALTERPVFHKGLGEFFRGLREARGWNQRQAAEIAGRRGLDGLTRQVLLRLENGRTKNPEPSVLRALARLYDMTYAKMAARVVAVRFELDVQRVDEKGMAITDSEAAHVRTAARVAESFEDRDLPATDHYEPSAASHDEPVLATTRAQLDRAIAELLAVSKQLARGQAAMGRVPRSGAARRPRKNRRQRDRQLEADATKKR